MIIGLSGAMGSGKSTAVRTIQELSPNTHLLKFAEPIYDIQEMVYDRIRSVYKRPKEFVKDRKLLQWIGTEFGRQLSETLWTDIWQTQAKEFLQAGDSVICDDVRFDNEAELIRTLGGIIISIDSAHNLDRITTNTGIKAHASEAGLNPSLIDIKIVNNGTIQEFEEKIKAAYYSQFI